MAFRNFIYTKDDDDLAFLPKEPSLGFDSRESLKAGMFVVHPRSVAARIKERKCKTMGGSLRPHIKRKLAFGSSSSRAMHAKTPASKDDTSFVSISDDNEGLLDCFELKDANDCHLKISAITPPPWKGHLDNQMDLELLDLHDRYNARQAVMDNAVNRRAREFLQVIEKMSGEADVIKARERSREEECEGLRVKCYQVTLSTLESKVNSLEVDKARLEAVEVSLHKEVRELKQDRRDVVSKVVPYAAMELLHSDELGMLVGKLVSFAITYGCDYEGAFDLSKAKGYHSSYQKDHTQASNDFANTTFPWLDKFVADAAALNETLLSKKPPMLQKHAPSRTQMHMPSSQKATLSSTPSLNPMSPSVDLVKPPSSPLE
uniref:Uncharacterized protein n=1 Tax=Tanacetum cinerariifolium TaxID=118510 RepID=A0A699KEX5_TANCI|nr:hypothetical protein [Tanacetum cinerariifolium]